MSMLSWVSGILFEGTFSPWVSLSCLIPMFRLVSWFLYFVQHLIQEFGVIGLIDLLKYMLNSDAKKSNLTLGKSTF